MRIAVIGAGIAGITTAHELSRDGHQVLVIDRGTGIATEGSYANGGLMAPDYLAAWGAPGLPRRLVAPPWRRQASWLRDGAPPASWPWLWRWQRAHRRATALARQTALLQLGRYSQSQLEALTQGLQLDYERSAGQLVLLRDDKDLARLRPGLAWLGEQGVAPRLVDAAEARTLEPALHPDTALHAALHLPGSLVANSRQFAHQLKGEAQAQGVRWLFQHEVVAMEPGSPWRLQSRPRQDALDAAATGQAQTHEVDAVVLCAAASAPTLLHPLGLRLPLQAVHGHSVTAAARIDEAHASQWPVSGVLDERHQVAIARQGDRIRVSGGAELGGSADRLNPQVLARLYRVLDDWFPGAAHTARALQWRGTRWLLPDGLPLVGAGPAPGLWLNLGLGASGWALGCGTARLLADQLAGRPTEIDTQGLGLVRLR